MKTHNAIEEFDKLVVGATIYFLPATFHLQRMIEERKQYAIKMLETKLDSVHYYEYKYAYDYINNDIKRLLGL